MTLIGAGIQMVPERLSLPFVENFRWKNREKLFATLRANEADNVVLLSGDVHLGQIYKAQCPQFTGQSLLPEITSSGLSHTQADFFPHPAGNMRMFSTPETTELASEIFLGYNYGNLLIKGDAKQDSDILL